MSTHLVTGAAGFIGSHLVERLLADGHDVIGIDDFDSFYPRTAKERNLVSARANPRFRFHKIDLRDSQAVAAALERDGVRPDAIVHLAAKAGVRPSISDPVGYQEVNVAGTQNLLELARRLGVKQFVFASSSSVYGINPNVPWREDDAVLQPISPYASNKLSAELMGHVYSHLYGIRFLALRLFTVYGPRQRPDLAIHKFARLMRAGEPVPVFGDGTTRRDYTFVGDVVDALAAALRYDGSRYEVINVGHNEPVSLNTLIKELESALGVRAILDRRPEQPGDVPQTWADLTKARSLLGYQPRVSLREGLRRFADWLEGNDERPCT